MSDTKLEPCPFCGGAAGAYEYVSGGNVHCGSCAAQIEVRLSGFDSAERMSELCAIWNTRPALADTQGGEGMKAWDRGFYQGVLACLYHIHFAHGESTLYKELVSCNGGGRELWAVAEESDREHLRANGYGPDGELPNKYLRKVADTLTTHTPTGENKGE